MNATELIKPYVNEYNQHYTQMYFAHHTDFNIPESILSVIQSLDESRPVSQDQIVDYKNALQQFNDDEKRVISWVIHEIGFKIYSKFETTIESDVAIINNALRNNQAIPQESHPTHDAYLALVLFHHQSRNLKSTFPECYSYLFPSVYSSIKDILNIHIPFAINVLRLRGKLPCIPDFYGADLSQPFYPIHLNQDSALQVPLRRGIKESNHWYPFQMAKKIFKGDTGDNTFLATNGKKILYIRGVQSYAPNAILASKIATLVSPQHFSSERLLSNHLVGSRELSSYAVSLAAIDCNDNLYRDAEEYIITNQRVFPGSGIIDEITNFVQESDSNTENYGLSSRTMDQSHLSKIDFDLCSITYPITKEEYEQDLLANNFYTNSEYVTANEGYIQEKLCTRLKLSMLTEPLFRHLAAKAYAPKDEEVKLKAIIECTKRVGIAWQLFLESPYLDSFLRENSHLLTQCQNEICDYVRSHFDESHHAELFSSLALRFEIITSTLSFRIQDDFSSQAACSTSSYHPVATPITSHSPIKQKVPDLFFAEQQPIDQIRNTFATMNQAEFFSWVFRIASDPQAFMEKNKYFLTEIQAIDALEYLEKQSEDRRSTEDRIVNSLNGLQKNHHINLLSLGSDNYLQDFLLLIRLYHAGYRKINFDKLNIDPSAPHPSYTSRMFRILIEQFNRHGSRISYHSVSRADDLPNHRRYHVIFGINLVEAQGYIGFNAFDKTLARETIKKTTQMVSQVVQAASLIHRRKEALFFLNNGISTISWNKTKTEAPLESKPSFYIRANIVNLINRLQFIVNNSPCELFIDSAILDRQTEAAIIRLLDKYPEITYQILDNANIVDLLKVRENNTTFVIDESYIDDTNASAPISDCFPSSIDFSCVYLSKSASLTGEFQPLILQGKTVHQSLIDYKSNRENITDSLWTLQFKPYARKEIKCSAAEKLISFLDSSNAPITFTPEELRALEEGRLNTLIPIKLLRIIKLQSYIANRKNEQTEYLSLTSQFFKPRFNSTNKIQAAEKLLSLYTDSNPSPDFTDLDLEMLEDGRLGRIVTPEVIQTLKEKYHNRSDDHVNVDKPL